MQSITCPKCSGEMETGFLIDKSHGDQYSNAPEWAEGAPETSFWTGLELKGRERHPVVTYRCSTCGYLESYARAG